MKMRRINPFYDFAYEGKYLVGEALGFFDCLRVQTLQIFIVDYRRLLIYSPAIQLLAALWKFLLF